MNEKQKIALVTGANRGLGREVSLRLADLGHHVIVTARSASAAAAVAREISATGGSATFARIDLADRSTFVEAAGVVEREFGRLDVLVNNAGVMMEGDWMGNTADSVDMAVFRSTFEINFFGLVDLTLTMLPLLRQSDAANIVNVSSVMGSLTLQADPDRPNAMKKPFAYDASKTAVNAFTVHLAAALRETRVVVNSAHPGWVRTDLGGEAASMTVEEGADTIVVMATAESGITGQFIHQGEPVPW